ncbi:MULTISPECIES: indolepyruvate ferredoxin oxidoreductase family protein [Rhodomicrobium]|uniref:indolepyruvate ferredoxin oxidoreductase family protein n=1 Tax=Rhodomicrobium TaxID=1068 RepID=UPI000B4B610D|nr:MULTISPECIES: indolepyruvate ferredoxin oxidoreductase family protein [Rhodomicrobium]
MTDPTVRLDDKYLSESGSCLIGGVQALVRLPLDQIRRDRLAGLNTGGFISGYRGSPLAGYDQQLARAKKLLDVHNIHFQPGVNEDLAATAVWGSQQVNLHPGAKVDGVFGLWYGKAPGVDRSGDVFKHANMSGTAPLGGVLAIAGDDPLAKSSTLASQSEFALIDNEMPVLAAGDIQDLLDLGLHGIALSRFSGLWVGICALTDVLDGSATVNVDPARLSILMPPDDGVARHITLAGLRMQGRLGAEEKMLLVRLPAAKLYARLNRLNRVVWDSAAPRLGIIASGKNWSALRGALQLLGIDAAVADRLGLRVMKTSMPWPLDEADMRDFASGLQSVLVVEAKRPLIETQLKEQLYHWDAAKRPAIIGKRDLTGAPLFSEFGDLEAADIAAVLAKMLPPSELSARMDETVHRLERRERFGHKLATPSARPPHFCSGCPHNSSTVIPEGSRAMAGIGCHIMAQTMDGRAGDSFSQMGGEGVAWLGQSPFTETGHLFVNLGDGTYHHSGSLAIRAAVSAKAHVTYKILYNDAVAMTGGQHVEGPFGVAEIARQVAAEGVARIAIVAEDPGRHDAATLPAGVSIDGRDALDRVQRELRDTSGVTVLIFDQTCAAEKRRRRKRGEYPVPLKRMFINDRVCEACGDCSVQSNCLSIEPLETAFGTKRQINQSSCNMDYSCAKGFCPSFVVVEGAALKQPEFAPDAIIAAAAALVEPVATHGTREVKILLTGIGGTGVTTVSAILAMAAHLDGRQVATLDVTGLAQKGGAVLSHLAIAPAGGPAPIAKIAPGGTDCLIAGDLVVSAGEACLTLCDPGRTFAVADEEIAPTADFVLHQSLAYRTSRPAMRLRNAVHELTAQPVASVAKRLLGDTLYANMMLTGMAFQRGRLPLSLAAIESAIALNGTAVPANLAAFHAGRLLAAKPEALPGFTAPVAAPAEDLDALIERLAGELAAYQNAAYAERFRALVARVRAAETKLGGAKRLALTEAVARSGFKLMAYKDEYEVARLYADPAFKAKLAASFEDGGKLSVQLAPPLISGIDPATGRPRKITFGPWIFTAFTLLARFKPLRGTPLDPFGWTKERRAERRLAENYERTIDGLLPALTSANLGVAIAIAQLPQQIRGYGPVKAARMAEAEALEAQLLARFRSPDKRPGDAAHLIAAE